VVISKANPRPWPGLWQNGQRPDGIYGRAFARARLIKVAIVQGRVRALGEDFYEAT
jgi:hypothetical protein